MILFRKKLKVGSHVVLIPKGEAGIVKKLVPDGKRAFVWYHRGCTATGTRRKDLKVVSKKVWDKLYNASYVHTGCNECMPYGGKNR